MRPGAQAPQGAQRARLAACARSLAALAALAGAAAACNGGAATSSAASPDPACTCTCPPGAPPAPGAPAAAASAGSADLGELVASANRKMFHDDGAGCLADLDRVAQLDPLLAGRLAAVRGQCEMLAGRCQEGKQRVAAYYRDETNLSQERADQIAEQIGSMRCRGGNSSPRDELLRAFYELTDGAYMNRKEPAFCRERLATVRRLAPAVPPAGPEDTQVDGAKKALFHTAAACLVKAGDCGSAFEAYRDNFPGEGLSAIKDPAQRASIVRDAFFSSFAQCKGAQ